MTSETPSILTPAILELIGLGASAAANCEPCFRYHYDQAKKLGISDDDMLQAVNLALTVKAAPHRSLIETAQQLLVPGGGCGCNGDCSSETCDCTEGSCSEGGCGCN
jgi:AhpD family alkylhydroperoxidase